MKRAILAPALLVASLVLMGATLISVKSASLGDDAEAHECNSTEWHFVITQVEPAGNAPASIEVTWANGATETVPLDKVTGKTAHYATTSNLGSTVTGATANIYDAWSSGTGQFNLSHGPCGQSTTTTTTVVTTTTVPDTTTTVEETTTTVEETTTTEAPTTTVTVQDTTTTVEDTTTTVEDTTTTVEETTTTEAPTTTVTVQDTTTTVDEYNTTTTVEETTTTVEVEDTTTTVEDTTTTVEETTTTVGNTSTSVEDTTTTVGDTTTTAVVLGATQVPAQGPASALAFTGSEAARIALVGLFLVAVGMGLVAQRRRLG